MLLLGLAGVVLVVFLLALLLVLRRHRQTAELQNHFHSAYDEGARWNSLGDTGDPTD
jgi:hypothetical protein